MGESQQGPRPVDKRAGARRRRGRGGQKAHKMGGRRKEAERERKEKANNGEE